MELSDTYSQNFHTGDDIIKFVQETLDLEFPEIFSVLRGDGVEIQLYLNEDSNIFITMDRVTVFGYETTIANASSRILIKNILSFWISEKFHYAPFDFPAFKMSLSVWNDRIKKLSEDEEKFTRYVRKFMGDCPKCLLPYLVKDHALYTVMYS